MILRKIAERAIGIWIACVIVFFVIILAVGQVEHPCADGYHKWIDTVVHPGDSAGTTYSYCIRD